MASAAIYALATAIYRQEGTNPTDLNNRNNNPGNLRDPTDSTGAYQLWPDLPHDSNGFVIFPTFADGWNAMINDLQLKANRGWDLTQILSAWAPPGDGNNTVQYISNVNLWTGIPIAGTPVENVTSANTAWNMTTLLGDNAPVDVSTLPGGVDLNSITSALDPSNLLSNQGVDLSSFGLGTVSPIMLMAVSALGFWVLGKVLD